MKRSFTVGLAMVAGAALGAAAVEGLHAQAKPPVYQIVEIDVLNQDAYVSDYAPKAQAAIKAAGGKFLAAGGKTTTIEGDPPKSRIVIQQWDSVEKIAAYRASAAFKDLLPLRDKLAKFRSFTVEGVPQKSNRQVQQRPPSGRPSFYQAIANGCSHHAVRKAGRDPQYRLVR